MKTIETNIFVGGPKDREIYNIPEDKLIVKTQIYSPINDYLSTNQTIKEFTYSKFYILVGDIAFGIFAEKSIPPEKAIEKILNKYVKRRKKR